MYPIDALGIRTQDAFRASAGNSASAGGDGFHAAQALLATRTFTDDNYDAHQTMNQLAEDTGGKAYFNSNGLAEAAAQAIANGASYYTLSYVPSNPSEDGSYRAIRIKLDRAGVKLFYRHGYYAESPTSSKSATASATPSVTRAGALYGGPPATQILIKTFVQPVGTRMELKPAEGNTPVAKDGGPWTRYSVNIAADTHAMNFNADPGGHLHDTIQCTTLVYSLDGQLVNSVLSAVKADLTPENYKTLLQEGLHVSQQISVPAKGNYALRIMVHDLGGDRLGSLELPLAAVRSQPQALTPSAENKSSGASR